MTDHAKALSNYLEADSWARASCFRSFLAAVSDLKSKGDMATAAQFARRAVTPLLDYTSLFALSKYRSASLEYPEQPETLRIAVLGGPTTIQLVQLIEVFLWAEQIPARVYQCDYGLFRQEILTEGSGLDQFAPQIVFLANDCRDISRLPNLDDNKEDADRLVCEEMETWCQLWDIARSKWNSTVIQNSFVSVGYPALGHLATRIPASPEAFVSALNQRMSEMAPGHVVFHDMRLLVCERGTRQWFDPRFYLEAKMPCAPECLVTYAHSVVSVVRAIRGKSKKVLVLDLDNTIWGGVIGDVGVEGIQLGHGSGEGEAFLAFQQYAKALHDRGILLAVCSKNDDARAREPFEKLSDMVLRLEHIACFRANWSDKPQNLQSIAETLGLPLESFVFVDDNPVERALIRRTLPEVSVPDLLEDPAGYGEAVSVHRYFETFSYTKEDSQRSCYYRDNAQRAAIASQTCDLGAFLKSLEMVARSEPVNSVNIQRVTQLLNKSNQFNLTTKRYVQAEIERIAAAQDWSTLAISLRDRCGDNGLISVLFFRGNGTTLVIDTWLMSCRVLQRGVEDFALAKALDIARRLGCTVLEGRYIPTEKNGMVCDHYKRLGFHSVGTEGSATVWQLSVEGWVSPSSCCIHEESQSW
jgi:FkbH-like protein